MIREYFGLLGCGKTTNMVYDARYYIKRGRKVVSNTPLQFCTKNKLLNMKDHTLQGDCKYKGDHCWSTFYQDAEEYLWHMIHDEKALFLIDEASIILPPKVKVPRNFIHKFVQSRKDYCDVFYTAQVPKFVYPLLRALTNETVRCTKFPALGMFWRLPYFHVKKDKFVMEWVDSYYLQARWYNTHVIESKMNFYDRKGRDRAWRNRIISPSAVRPVFMSFDTMFKVNYSENFKTRATAVVKEKTSLPVDKQIQKQVQTTLTEAQRNIIAEAEEAIRGVEVDRKKNAPFLLSDLKN